MKRIVSALIAAILVISILPVANARNNWNMEYFYKNYPDPHFNLNNDPHRVMTIEEFIAIIHAYSYYGSGASNITVRDKTGKFPSAWCAKYVQAEADKKVFDPERIEWNQPVTIAFAAQFMARAKGKYSYDSNNIYSFKGTENLSADDILYLSVAVDHGLIPYSAGMDVSTGIKRKDARNYEIPANIVYAKAKTPGSANTMRETHAYFIDCYWDFAAADLQLSRLKQNAKHITMVTFQSGYLNGSNIDDGNEFLGCDIEHKEAISSNRGYDHDPQLDAIEYCREQGISTLLGVSNVRNNSFSGDSTETLFLSGANMQTAIQEMLDAVNKYELDGVNLGIEISDPEYAQMRYNYSAFVQQLANALHRQGKLLMVSVGSYFTDEQERNSIYDYSAIGRAADYVHIILYDDYNDTGFAYRGTHGPISNLTRVGRCVRYASIKMDSSKILLGMGTYAIDFNLTQRSAHDINYNDAIQLRQKTGATVVYDNSNNAAGAYFEYTDASYCRHRVYMETGYTAQMRAGVAKNYNLCGVSIFNLNDNNTPVYTSITGSSAYKEEVVSAMRSGLVPIALRGNYDKPILRREFCTIVVNFIEKKIGMTAEELLNLKGKSINYYAFYDTTERDVLIANAFGIVGGYGDGSFAPDKTISRQEAATMLTRLAFVMGFDHPNSTAISFVESPSLQLWAQQGIDFISGCVDLKSGKRVMGGTGNNKFSPYGTYTREQTYMSIYRLFNAF